MAAPAHQLLLSETQERIAQLEDAIAQINAVRKGLKENAIEVKSQISAVFGRQLECLRSRELWLQGQVELVEHAKEALLRRQQDRLCQLLGALSTSLAYSQDEEGGVTLDKKLAESIERLDQMDLKPQESSNISFRADVTGLRQSIRSFGRVDSKGLPLENAFVGPETTSSCLPRTYEDYGEPEHLVLYKTVEEIRREKGESNNVNVCVPRLGAEPKSPWLSYSLSASSLDKLGANGSSDFPERTTGGRYSLTSEHSIQHWLQHIKGHVETEEDDYEIISAPRTHTVSTSSESIEVVPSSEIPTSAQPEFSYFNEIQNSPLRNWISKRPAPSEVSENVPKRLAVESKRSLAQLHDWEQWLAKKPQVSDNVDGCCQGSCATTPNTPVDIENLDILQCTQDSSYWSQANTNKAWLSRMKKPSAGSDEKDVDEKEEIMQVCRANEVCETFSDCVCDEKCCGSIMEKDELPSSVKEWLPRPVSAGVTEDLKAMPFLSYFNTVSTLPLDWLSKQQSSTQPELPSSLFPVFQQESCPDQWLLKQNVTEEQSIVSPAARQPNTSLQWVKPSCQAADDLPYDLFPMFKKAHTESNKSWVHPAPAASPAVPACIQSTLKHMENIVSATPAQWLPGNTTASSTPMPNTSDNTKCWLKTPSTLSGEQLQNQVVEDLMEGLRKLSFAWQAHKSNEHKNADNSTNKSSFLGDTSKWLSGTLEKSTPTLTQESTGPKKVDSDWLMKSASEEEDDSQWLLRKESAPSSPSHGLDMEKLADLFPCFQSKEDLGNWLLAQANPESC